VKVFSGKRNLRYVNLENNSCISGVFYSSNFLSMRNNLEQKCSLTIVSLKRELLTLKNEYIERNVNFNAQMKNIENILSHLWSRLKAEFENKTSDLNASLSMFLSKANRQLAEIIWKHV
jgi:hypothetical protein